MPTLAPKVTLVANGDSLVVDYYGGECFYSAAGTWGGGTTTLMVSFDEGVTYISAGSNGILSANGVARFRLPRCKMKVTLSAATAPSLTISLDSLL